MTPATAIADGFARVRAAGFVGKAERLSDVDLPRIGHTIGVGEDEIHAVIEVETAGGGFDAHRRPKLLFEPHIFYRNLTDAARSQAVMQGLAYAQWGAKPYPGDSYPRLVAAMAIDETAALKSASWGLGQILGENFVAAGYESPQAMVLAFVEGGEAEHLVAMVRFIKANHLDDELRAHNWPAFARGYNGAGYARNAYHTKLAAAYARWRGIPDTPWSPGQNTAGKAAPPPTVSLPEAIERIPVPRPEPAPPMGLWARVAGWLRKADAPPQAGAAPAQAPAPPSPPAAAVASGPRKFLQIGGDSIGKGTDELFQAAEVDAKVGIPSREIIARIRPGYLNTVISAGSNDIPPAIAPAAIPAAKAMLIANLRRIRARTDSPRVVWIVPVQPDAAAAVRLVAAERGDETVAFLPGGDHVHPKSYALLAQAVSAKLLPRDAAVA